MRNSMRRLPKWNWTMLFSLAIAVVLLGCEDPESKLHMSALRELASSMPVYSNFREVKSYDNNKIGDAILIVCYESPAKWDDVSHFYSQTLLERGWSDVPEEERRRSAVFHSEDGPELVFRSGEYQIGIRRAKENAREYNYLITYYWERH
jgi:hypothetical protein